MVIEVVREKAVRRKKAWFALGLILLFGLMIFNVQRYYRFEDSDLVKLTSNSSAGFQIGGRADAVQSITNTDTANVETTAAQINGACRGGCENCALVGLPWRAQASAK